MTPAVENPHERRAPSVNLAAQQAQKKQARREAAFASGLVVLAVGIIAAIVFWPR